jgi:DMSO reductase family type II enzyme heme b subunit
MRISAFWRALLVIAVAYLLFDNAFPPLLPRSLMVQYMAITIVGVLLYYASDDTRWAEFKAPVLALLHEDRLAPLRWALLIAIPVGVAYGVHLNLRPSLEAPLESRQVHPAPPSTLQAFGKRFDLATLENPVRSEILETMKQEPEAGWEKYQTAASAGRDLYYQNCFYCHGDLLDGQGHYASALNPRPISFQDPTLIPQLQESYLFWRMATGGPGLPREGAPWDSAMPAWHGMLEEQDLWNLLIFIFDYNGQVPSSWDEERARAMSSLRGELLARRKNMQGMELYQFRCAVCHGEQGMGDGVAAELMYSAPRDFSLALFKYKSSPGTLPPRDQDIFDAIKRGLPGTAMPGWGSLLTDAQIQSLIPVIKGFDISLAWAPEDAPDGAFDEEGRYTGPDLRQITEQEPLEGQIAYSEDSLAKGREAYLKACEQCHGAEGRGNVTSGKRLEDDWGQRVWPRNLTQPWTWRSVPEGADRDAVVRQIYARISIGIPGTPMPAHRALTEGEADPVSREERWHIANYVYSLRDGALPPVEGAPIKGVKLEGDAPSSPDDERWGQAPAATLRLLPNIIEGERLYTPLNEAVTVRVLYSDKEIAFLLELDDRTHSRPGDPYFTDLMDESKGDMMPDAFAIQFPQQDAYTTAPVEKPLYRHGDSRHRTTIWYWNAGAVDEEARAVLFDGNGLDKKLKPREQGDSLAALGEWKDGKWRVLMKRPRDGGASGDVRFDEGRFIPIAFANWDGSNGEVGSKHSLTGWCWLMLPPQIDMAKVYGLPAGIGLLVFLAGLGLVTVQRRNV